MMTSKLLTGIIALALPIYVAAQIKTTDSETQLLNRIEQDIAMHGKISYMFVPYDGRFQIPFRMEKKFYTGNDSLTVTVFNVNINDKFDDGDLIVIDEVYYFPHYKKSRTEYTVEPSFEGQFDLGCAKGMRSTDKVQSKELEKNVWKKTKELYKTKLRALEQAYSRR